MKKLTRGIGKGIHEKKKRECGTWRCKGYPADDSCDTIAVTSIFSPPPPPPSPREKFSPSTVRDRKIIEKLLPFTYESAGILFLFFRVCGYVSWSRHGLSLTIGRRRNRKSRNCIAKVNGRALIVIVLLSA